MLLKCVDGPMDGAVYALSRETFDPANRSTNRKPDGLWFDGQEENGWVQDQYGFDRLAEGGDHVTMIYRYGGSIPLLVPGSLKSCPLTLDEHTEERIKNATEGAVDAYDE